jgi:hypothetical protein
VSTSFCLSDALTHGNADVHGGVMFRIVLVAAPGVRRGLHPATDGDRPPPSSLHCSTGHVN